MYIDYARLSLITPYYEIWCTNPVQCIDRWDTEEEANEAMKGYQEGGIIHSEWSDREYNPKNFVIIPAGTDLEEVDFIKKRDEEYHNQWRNP